MKFTLATVTALAAAAMASPVAIEKRYPSDCTAFYECEPNDTCDTIGNKFGNFTLTQFYLWNPDIAQTCFDLYYEVPYCINTPGYVFTPPVQPSFGTHYSPEQTPVPIMPNITSSCKDFELVAPGTRVDTLGAENGFTQEQFEAWNGGANTAWASYWACVKA